ncbi:MAG: cupin domain-containing protein [Bacteroidetes bacterium]|nr:cupin domain-containing protein [Bacteroidota bacterium]
MIHRASEAEVIFEIEGAVGKKAGVINNCEYVRLSIDPGKIIPSHSLDVPVTFYVIAGSAEVTLTGEMREIAAGDMLEIKPNLEREWNNTGIEKLELLVVKHL